MDTKDHAIQIAKSHLQLRGYNGFSFQDIADELGIRKASLHYYFSSKEDLGLALISNYSAAFQQWVGKFKEDSPLAQVERYIQMFSLISQDDLKICPAGVLCIDLNTLPSKMQKAVSSFQEEQKQWLEKVLNNGIKNGDFTTSLSAKEMAQLLMSTCQGSLQIARMQNNSRLAKATCQNLLTLLTT